MSSISKQKTMSETKQIKLMSEIKKIMLEKCNRCGGVGKHEYIVIHNLTDIKQCEICRGTGERLSNFARDIFQGRK